MTKPRVLVRVVMVLSVSILWVGPVKADAVRKFYLTRAFFNGSQALQACAKGYHLASIWEIHEPSSLVYNTSLGFQNAPYQMGPPSSSGGSSEEEGLGWLDVGGFPDANTNCGGWTLDINARGYRGLLRSLPDLSGWLFAQTDCSQERRVWCVSNP